MFELGHDGYTCNDSEWHFAIPHWLKPAFEISYHLRVKRCKSRHSGVIFKIKDYRQTPNISGAFVGNKIVDHSDVVGASPVGAAQTKSSFSTQQLASMD